MVKTKRNGGAGYISGVMRKKLQEIMVCRKVVFVFM